MTETPDPTPEPEPMQPAALSVPALAGLQANELKECLALGATLGEIKELAESGFGYEDIRVMAPQLAAARQTSGGSGVPDALITHIGNIAEGVKKERPENVSHPDVSVLNPLGERDHPRPALKCRQFWWGGFLEQRTDLSLDEIALVNALEAGEYWVTRTDETKEKVPVLFFRDGMDRLDRIVVKINTGKEHKTAWPSKLRILRELVEQAKSVAA